MVVALRGIPVTLRRSPSRGLSLSFDARSQHGRLVVERVIAMDQLLNVEGKVTKVLPGTMFHVELPNKHQVLAHISGKMRKRFIRLSVGDRVKMEMTPYDLQKARIVYRLS